MNRSFISVIAGGFGGDVAVASGAEETRPVKQGSADDAAFIMKNAASVIIVPGYGMAGRPSAARAARDGGQAQSRRRESFLRYSSGGGTHAWAHERAPSRSECAL